MHNENMKKLIQTNHCEYFNFHYVELHLVLNLAVTTNNFCILCMAQFGLYRVVFSFMVVCGGS